MKEQIRYPKRLIEVDLPIKRISAHARREKSIRHGHISTLHIWWARRPLAACRAVICAALWPDPADDLCPKAFRKAAADALYAFAEKVRTDKQLAELCASSWPRWKKLTKGTWKLDDKKSLEDLRGALLDFIADFANWDSSTVPAFLETARALTQAAHEALGGAPGTRPLVVDPFAGGGSIPLEALRVGADAFASDLNPVAVLLNKVVLEYIPKYGQRLADEVRKWGEWIKKEAEKELAEFYPKDPDGATPIAYLWARTIKCEGPGCGAEVPLIRSLWLAKKANRSVALQLVPRPRANRVEFRIIKKQGKSWVNQDDPKTKTEDPKFDGTVKRGSATCPCCGYTTPVTRVRDQLKVQHGGANEGQLFCVVVIRLNEVGRCYRMPSKQDVKSFSSARERLAELVLAKNPSGGYSVVPDEIVDTRPHAINRLAIYGMLRWCDAFNARQLLSLITLTRLVQVATDKLDKLMVGDGIAGAVATCLALSVSKSTDLSNSLTRWKPDAECPVNLFARQAIPIVWEYAETAILSESSGSWTSMVNRTADAIESAVIAGAKPAVSLQSNATQTPLPSDAAQCFITDPPYYDAISYADLSDFFFVWLKRALPLSALGATVTPKDEECIVDTAKGKTRSLYESTMLLVMSDGRRVLAPDGIGVVVFAHKTTSGWESQLQAMIDAGWIVTASWPIDTEMQAKVAGIGQARLMSSIHLVCRPRENPDGSVRTDEVGDWRDVLAELPKRIHDWMPRLAEEGVVGADAIFACLGPALEIFSRYSRVEKASGEPVTLKEYLEQVWAAVSKEALKMIFEGADATGFEEDARLTAMWLWTLSTGGANGGGAGGDEEVDAADDDEESDGKGGKGKLTGFMLEYDAARKIAQGLGAHLEALTSLVEVKGDKARLLPVAERTSHLFGKGDDSAPSAKKRKKKAQLTLGFVAEVEEAEESGGWGKKGAPEKAETVLDRVHQAMILFAAGRSEALKRFLVDEGVGRDEKFWRLAQALSALYPPASEEKRWVDGVMARKKGLGF